MKNNQQGARPIAVILSVVAIMLLTWLAIWSTKQKQSTTPANVAMVQPAQKPVQSPDVYPQVAVVRHGEVVIGVAPETEEALNKFGLSGTSIVPIGVKAVALKPVVVGSYLTQTNK